LITVSIIAIMASMVLFAVYSAQEMAKSHKTKALITKLHAIIKAKYETYKTRRVPLALGADTFTDSNMNGVWDTGEPLIADWNGNGSWDMAIAPPVAAKLRLDCLRDLLRMEMPDRWSDIRDPPATPLGFPPALQIARPAVSLAYERRMNAVLAATGMPLNGEFAGAECLYMIVMQAQQEDADDRSAIKPDSIGDVDGDGFPEFVDGWGRPIKFLRWAPGFVSELHDTLKLTVASMPAPTMIVTAANSRLDSKPGSYLGGAIIMAEPATATAPAVPGTYRPTIMAKIIGYAFTPGTPPTNPGTATFTVAGAPGFTLTTNDEFYVTAPDPFDPTGVYPINPPPPPGQPTPNFAIYPLIYSSGPDKCYGICADFDSASPLQYAGAAQMNPFTIRTDNVDGLKRLIGSPRDESGEPNFVQRGWIDNIHNHLISAR
jgi:hypothetical protein